MFRLTKFRLKCLQYIADKALLYLFQPSREDLAQYICLELKVLSLVVSLRQYGINYSFVKDYIVAINERIKGKPWWPEQTRHTREPGPNLRGRVKQMFSCTIFFLLLRIRSSCFVWLLKQKAAESATEIEIAESRFSVIMEVQRKMRGIWLPAIQQWLQRRNDANQHVLIFISSPRRQLYCINKEKINVK